MEGATGKDFANIIFKIVHNPDKWSYMKRKCKEVYESDLNWTVFGNKINQIIDKVIKSD